MNLRSLASVFSLVVFLHSAASYSEEVPAFTIDWAKSSNHMLLTSGVFTNTLALVEEKNGKAEIIRVERLDPRKLAGSQFISSDGQRFGVASAEALRRDFQLHVFDESNKDESVFPAFGIPKRLPPTFGISDDATTVISTGKMGVSCWNFKSGEWKEKWALDNWKTFNTSDWSVGTFSGRHSTFDAFIPSGKDFAILIFIEHSQSGIDPEFRTSGRIASVDLSNGNELWRMDLPKVDNFVIYELKSNSDGSNILLCPMNSRGSIMEIFHWVDGKLIPKWSGESPTEAALCDTLGLIAFAHQYPDILLEVLNPDGSKKWSQPRKAKLTSLAFEEGSENLFATDSLGNVTKFDASGNVLWTKALTSRVSVRCKGKRVYLACYDGMLLRAFNTSDGTDVWSLDCSSVFGQTAVEEKKIKDNGRIKTVVQPSRKPTTSNKVPAGENLMLKETSILRAVTKRRFGEDVVKDDNSLNNGKTSELLPCWLDWDEFESGTKVRFEIMFKEPTDVISMTVYENPDRPDSWPTEGLVERWDEDSKSWKTAAFGLFMVGPINTYKLDLKSVKKIRYIPWNGFTGGLYTTEIEVR